MINGYAGKVIRIQRFDVNYVLIHTEVKILLSVLVLNYKKIPTCTQRVRKTFCGCCLIPKYSEILSLFKLLLSLFISLLLMGSLIKDNIPY